MLVSFRGQKVVDKKIDRYLLGFVMKISDGHPYHLYIKRTPQRACSPLLCFI